MSYTHFIPLSSKKRLSSATLTSSSFQLDSLLFDTSEFSQLERSFSSLKKFCSQCEEEGNEDEMKWWKKWEKKEEWERNEGSGERRKKSAAGKRPVNYVALEWGTCCSREPNDQTLSSLSILLSHFFSFPLTDRFCNFSSQEKSSRIELTVTHSFSLSVFRSPSTRFALLNFASSSISNPFAHTNLFKLFSSSHHPFSWAIFFWHILYSLGWWSWERGYSKRERERERWFFHPTGHLSVNDTLEDL